MSKGEATAKPNEIHMPFDRITFEPGKMGGRACIRGFRITVGLIVSLVAESASWTEILRGYPDLEPEDIRQALNSKQDCFRHGAAEHLRASLGS
jgi:uncharacterized protein (DUF433 family)